MILHENTVGDELNPNSTIENFFANKNIFITGGTGFLGTVLIESILSTSPNVGTIYVLVRDKYGSNSNSRIQRMLQKPIFEAHTEATLKKVVPVIGELNQPNLGMKKDVWEQLLNSVNIIYHSAATIKFNTHIRSAIQINLIGTMRTIEFAKQLKNLTSYVYLSTAFCNSDQRGYIAEKVYSTEYNPYDMMKMAEDDKLWGNAETEPNEKDFIGEHPNTYTFSKQLAENLILREMENMPAGIVRPSVVYGTYEYPVQGWVGNANSGHLGLLAGFVKGVFRTMTGKPQSVIDIIPCDFVINASITMAWYIGTRKISTPEVIHCTSGESNPITIEMFRDIVNESASKDPCDTIVWMPNCKIRNGLRYTVFFYLFHYLPALFFYLPELIFQIGKPHHSALTYMAVFDKGTKAFDYFLKKEFRYSITNAKRVVSLLQPKDKQRYQFDASHCDWRILTQRTLLGLRRYYFRESYATTYWHRTMYKIMTILYYIGWFVIWAGFYFAILPIVGSMSIAFGASICIWAFLVWL